MSGWGVEVCPSWRCFLFLPLWKDIHLLYIYIYYIYIYKISPSLYRHWKTSHLQLPQLTKSKIVVSGHEQSCPLWSGQKVFCGFDFQPTSGSFSLKNGWFFIASRVRIDRLFRGRNYQVALGLGRFLWCFDILDGIFCPPKLGKDVSYVWRCKSFCELGGCGRGKCHQWLCSWGDFTPSCGLKCTNLRTIWSWISGKN